MVAGFVRFKHTPGMRRLETMTIHISIPGHLYKHNILIFTLMLVIWNIGQSGKRGRHGEGKAKAALGGPGQRAERVLLQAGGDIHSLS